MYSDVRQRTSVLITQPAQSRKLLQSAPPRQVQHMPLSPPFALSAEPPCSAPPCPLFRSTSGFYAIALPCAKLCPTQPHPFVPPPLRTPSPRRKAKITLPTTPNFPHTKMSQNARTIFPKIRLLIQTLVLANIPTRTDIYEYIYRNSPCFSTYIFPPKGSKNVSEYILGKLSVIFYALSFNIHCFSNRSRFVCLCKCHSMSAQNVSFFP